MTRLLLAALCGLFVFPALARDPTGKYANSPNAEWFRSQHNDKGEWCCDSAGGHPFYGDYAIDSKDGSVTIHDDGKEYKLPSYMVLKGANPTGAAVWWYIDQYNGRTSYCFAPGTLS